MDCHGGAPGENLYVECTPVDGVRLPTLVDGVRQGLAGALPPSLGDLGPSLTNLQLSRNAIKSVPTEIVALKGLTYLTLYNNQLKGVPTGFRTFNPSRACKLHLNQDFSCANLGAGTTCCIGGNNCGEGLPGGPCYMG